MADCIFCKIINKEIPATIVYEDDKILAFEDINPQAPHHVLVIPREHIPTTNDLTPENSSLIGDMAYRAAQIAKERSLDQEGYRLVMNCQENAGQSVFHIHMHMLGGRSLQWPPG